MNLSSPRLPFYSVLAAATLPWFNGHTNSLLPGYLFDLILIGLAFAALATQKKSAFGVGLASGALLVCYGAACVMLFMIHRIHPLSDFLVIVPLCMAYTVLLSRTAVNAGGLLRQLRRLYVFHVCFILLEILLVMLDMRSILETLSGGLYRVFPSHLLVRLAPGFPHSAPNSFLMQGQAASHLVGATLLLHYVAPDGKTGLLDRLRLAGLFLLFLLVISNTSLLIFALLAFAVWFFRARLTARVIAVLLAAIVCWMFFEAILAIVFYRVFEGETFDQLVFDVYFHLFTVPFVNILDAQPMQFVFGHGRDRDALESGELGFVTLVFISGVYLIGLLVIWLSSILIRGIVRYARARRSGDPEVAAWRVLLLAGIVLSTAWAMSTAHYLILFIPGGMHLFAFGLAIVITASARLREPSQSRLPEEGARGQLRPAKGDLAPG